MSYDANRHRTRRSSILYLLLLLPYIGLLYPPLFARAEPSWLGFPYFYWYQLMWVPLSAACTGIVYLRRELT